MQPGLRSARGIDRATVPAVIPGARFRNRQRIRSGRASSPRSSSPAGRREVEGNGISRGWCPPCCSGQANGRKNGSFAGIHGEHSGAGLFRAGRRLRPCRPAHKDDLGAMSVLCTWCCVVYLDLASLICNCKIPDFNAVFHGNWLCCTICVQKGACLISPLPVAWHSDRPVPNMEYNISVALSTRMA